VLDNNCFFRPKGGDLSCMCRLYFDPVVKPNVVGVSMLPKIIEAIDDLGRDVAMSPDPEESGFYPDHHLIFPLHSLDPPAESIATLTLVANVAVCTEWSTMMSGSLDGDQPIELKRQGAMVTIDPLETVEEDGNEMWRVPVTLAWSDLQRQGDYGPAAAEMYFLSADGRKTSHSGMSGSRSDSGDSAQYTLEVTADSFAPASTQLIIRFPNKVEMVPVELHLKDVPIVDTGGY
jgi:hypothetical protein